MKRVQAVIKPERLDPIQHKLLIDLLVEDDEVAPVVAIIREEAKTAGAGDGLVFVLDCAAVYPIGD